MWAAHRSQSLHLGHASWAPLPSDVGDCRPLDPSLGLCNACRPLVEPKAAVSMYDLSRTDVCALASGLTEPLVKQSDAQAAPDVGFASATYIRPHFPITSVRRLNRTAVPDRPRVFRSSGIKLPTGVCRLTIYPSSGVSAVELRLPCPPRTLADQTTGSFASRITPE